MFATRVSISYNPTDIASDQIHMDVSVSVLSLLTDLVDYLLSFGAHPDVQDMWGRTPIMLAAELGEDEILSLLLQSQPDMKLVDKEGKGVQIRNINSRL